MSGQNAPVLDIPPGVVRNGTPYSVGRRWWDVNWVRWVNGQLQPIGGWVQGRNFGTDFGLIGNEWNGFSVDFTSNGYEQRTASVAEMEMGNGPADLEVIRDTFSWRDSLKNPWYAVGMLTKLKVASPLQTISTIYDITPTDLAWIPGGRRGFGAGPYGDGRYGRGELYQADTIGQWSLDNFGRYLVAVHSQDGRLLSWDVANPTTKAAPVTNAPIDNTLVVVTDERMVMVLGGKNNPRRVKWCDRENLTVWAASATNTAGGFELNSSGTIIAAARVQGGILVLTDVDAHLIEYVGAPFYYARRRLSEEVGCLGKNTLVGVTGQAVWLSKEGFWKYDGAITPLPSPIDTDILRLSNLSNPANVFLGYNAFHREVWAFYPSIGAPTPDSYVFVSIASEPYWSVGKLSRTAFLNPVWDTKPVMFNGQNEYQHEQGVLAAGASRVNDIYAETGEFEIGEGDRAMRVDRIWQDGISYDVVQGLVNESPYELTFKLRQAPSAPERIVGPITLNADKGYTSVRFRARSVQMRLQPIEDSNWALGKLRLRMKEGGAR